MLLLVVAVLFLRPAEVLPALEALPIYEVLIVGALAFSLPAVMRQLMPASVARLPLTGCVVGLAVAVFLSHMTHGQLYFARTDLASFIKLALFYLLVIALVDSPARLRTFLFVTCGYIVAIAALSLLNHHGIIQLEALAAMEMREGYDPESGARVITVRLQASGIFNDPNDFSLILAVGILMLAHLCLEAKGMMRRLAYVAPMFVLLYALALTRSRGGMISFVCGGMVLLVSKWGWKRALPLASLGLPLLLVAFGGRQTNFTFSEDDTGHGRVYIWRDAIGMFKAAPVFGMGRGTMVDEVGINAHNSFVHAFAELGFFGGMFFLGAFYIPASVLRRGVDRKPAGAPLAAVGDRGAPAAGAAAAELGGWRPCIFAILMSYAAGLCSLSRVYTVTTYLLLGIAGAYIAMATTHGVTPPLPAIGRLSVRLGLLSVAFLGCLYAFVNLIV